MFPRATRIAHQQELPLLAKGSAGHQLARRPLPDRQLTAADAQGTGAVALEGVQADLLEAPSPLVGPGGVHLRQEGAPRDGECGEARSPDAVHASRATADSARWIDSSAASRSTQAPGSRHRRISPRPSRAPSPSARRMPDRRALRAESALAGRPVRPERLHQRVAGVGAVAVGRQVAEQGAPLTAREGLLHRVAVDLGDQPAAQLDARRASQDFPKQKCAVA